MRHPWELWVGLRYTRAKRRNHFISFISMFSMLGIAVGVTALITVMSVMNGFERELRTRLVGGNAHASITSLEGGLSGWAAAADVARRHPEVVAAAPYVEGEGMVRAGSTMQGGMLRGIDPALEPLVSDFGGHMRAGALTDLAPGSFNIVLGNELADLLGVGIGDKVDVMIPQASVTPAGVLPRFRRFTVCGVFSAGHYDFDLRLVLINLHDAQVLLRMGDTVSGVRIKLADMLRAPVVSREVAMELPGIYRVYDWTRLNSNYFRAVATEKMVMFIILSLIVAVAAFNIVSTLVMVVQDKQADIAIVRTLGAAPRSILAVFLVQGTVIGLVGTTLGVLGGVTLALNVERIVPLLELMMGQAFLDPSIYYITELPSELKAGDVLRIGVLALVLSLVSGIYPAWRASRVLPAEALRYE